MPEGYTDERGDDVDMPRIIGLYALRRLTLGQAAERAGVSRVAMQEILDDAGVELRLGPESEEDAVEEARSALDV